MDFLVELIGDFAIEIWGMCAGKMFDPDKPRAKRMLFFLLCCLPVSALLILFGALIYERTDIICIVISYALYALAAFLFLWFGKMAWLGKTPKEPKVIAKMGDGMENFFVGYKNTVNDKSAPLKTRIVLFALPFVLLFSLAIFLIITVPETAWFGWAGMAVFLVCALICAKRIFGNKK
ncbi:MAG: hypothetical protein IJW21_05160 [Clostridia bacterium]|nr:hypothetical protein [Clostridia bacterium]